LQQLLKGLLLLLVESPRTLLGKKLFHHRIVYAPDECEIAGIIIKEPLIGETGVKRIRLIEHGVFAAAGAVNGDAHAKDLTRKR